jgi:hypothetical protein
MAVPFQERDFKYVVTALHNIEAIEKQSVDKTVYLRINNTSGSFEVHKSNIQDWYKHPDHTPETPVDVAVLPIDWRSDNSNYLFRALPANWISRLREPEYAFGLGDETIVCGLFRYSRGTQRNEPIVRVGNIAAIPDEKITTKWNGQERKIKAILIEARSIGGMSGSPVLINYGEVRVFGKDVKYSGDGPVLGLLGLVHGHWDENIKDQEWDMALEMGREERLNVGIAMVIPSPRILEALDHPDLLEDRKRRAKEADSDQAGTPDFAELEPPTKADNPQHKEDFNSLLGAAARKRPQGDQT